MIAAAAGGAPADARPGGRSYFVDGRSGSDSNTGTSPSEAWRTVSRANQADLGPGDRLLFAAGQVFAGTLRLAGEDSGADDAPVLVSSFGFGRATIDGGAGDGVVLADCACVRIRGIDVVGCGRKTGSDGAGVRLVQTRDVEIDGVDVSGFRVAGIAVCGDVGSRILRVHAHDNGAAGITAGGGDSGLLRSRELHIGWCLADNNPGDPKNLDNHSGNGIVVGGVDGALIEYCEATNNGWDMPRRGNGPVGIWAWNSDRVTIQHCISHGNRSPGADGGGFDFDGGVTHSVMQYNLAYGNEGTGYLLCQYPGAPPWHDNVVRYNVSIDDGSRNLHSGIGLWLGGPGIRRALIHNNTVVNRVHAVATLGDLPEFVYRNNVFVAGGDVLAGRFDGSRFERNLYWRTGKGAFRRARGVADATLEEWAAATGQETVRGRLVGLWADPLLVLPANLKDLPTDPRCLATMPFGRLRAGSPCAGAGRPIPSSGGRDLFGSPVPRRGRPSLGAHEAGAR